MVFEKNTEDFKNKKVKHYFNVSVIIDIELGDIKQ